MFGRGESITNIKTLYPYDKGKYKNSFSLTKTYLNILLHFILIKLLGYKAMALVTFYSDRNDLGIFFSYEMQKILSGPRGTTKIIVIKEVILPWRKYLQ